MILILMSFWLSLIAYRRNYETSTRNAKTGNRLPVSVQTEYLISKLLSVRLRTNLQIGINRFNCLKKRETVAYEWDACNAKVNRLQALLNPYPGACTNATKRPANESLRLEANIAATERLDEGETRRFLRVVLIPVRVCVGQPVAQLQTSVNE